MQARKVPNTKRTRYKKEPLNHEVKTNASFVATYSSFFTKCIQRDQLILPRVSASEFSGVISANPPLDYECRSGCARRQRPSLATGVCARILAVYQLHAAHVPRLMVERRRAYEASKSLRFASRGERHGYPRVRDRETSVASIQVASSVMEAHTPKREPRPSAEAALACSPSMNDTMFYPWNWGEVARNANLSPASSCSSPEYREHGASAGSGAGARTAGTGPESHRRGRPRADALTNLMMQGSTSPSSIKCGYCHRVFPREKSLQAHLRTHTGSERDECSFCRPPSFRTGSALDVYEGSPRWDVAGVEKTRGFIQRCAGGPATRYHVHAAARLLARASRQSAIMSRFKYLNGSTLVCRVTHAGVRACVRALRAAEFVPLRPASMRDSTMSDERMFIGSCSRDADVSVATISRPLR